jgi:hypothetical protein
VIVQPKELKLFNRKPKTATHPELRMIKDYRYMGAEMESLGRRLDSARQSLAHAKLTESVWAQGYWQLVVDRLLIQWRALPILHDGDLSHTQRPKWKIDTDWFERDDGIGHNGVLDKIMIAFAERMAGGPNLHDSWERARNARIAKAPQ